jgi:hypothetical protein
MINLKDSIEILKTPDKVFDGLIKVFSTQEYFKKWHKDHVKCNWIKGQPFEVGSILYCEEYLHGDLHKMKFQGVKKERNKKIEYKLLFPMSIICPKGSFLIEPKEGNSIFTAILSFRFGWFFQKFAKSRVEVITKHMKEEGENLKKLLENEIN